LCIRILWKWYFGKQDAYREILAIFASNSKINNENDANKNAKKALRAITFDNQDDATYPEGFFNVETYCAHIHQRATYLRRFKNVNDNDRRRVIDRVLIQQTDDLINNTQPFPDAGNPPANSHFVTWKNALDNNQLEESEKALQVMDAFNDLQQTQLNVFSGYPPQPDFKVDLKWHKKVQSILDTVQDMTEFVENINKKPNKTIFPDGFMEELITQIKNERQIRNEGQGQRPPPYVFNRGNLQDVNDFDQYISRVENQYFTSYRQLYYDRFKTKLDELFKIFVKIKDDKKNITSENQEAQENKRNLKERLLSLLILAVRHVPQYPDN
jgi:hypothetical protein